MDCQCARKDRDIAKSKGQLRPSPRCFADAWSRPCRSWQTVPDSYREGSRNERPELVEMAVKDGGDLLDFLNKFSEFFRKDGLDAIGEGFFGLMVDLDKESVGANGRGGT